jgi:sugar phosphate isomerase/epimerase
VWPVIEEYDLGVCLDVGHILAYSQEGLLDVFSLWERVGLVHVYGTEINGKHLGLDSLDEHGIQILRAILDNIPKRTVLLLELFDREKFDYSRDILSKLMKKWGMGLDYPDTGRE